MGVIRIFILSMEKSEVKFACLLAMPALIVLLLTTTFPLLYLVWNSFFQLDLASPYDNGFVGLDNYLRMIYDHQFWESILLTVIYTTSTVFLQVTIGLAIAMMVMKIPKGQALFRISAILPIVLAPVVVGLFWRTLMLEPDFGVFDFAVKALGLGEYNWLGDAAPALFSVILIHTWQWTPFAVLIFLASLAALPEDVYEASSLDKAGKVKQFWYITLPLMRPAIVIVIIMRSMIALSAFAAIFAATGGGPGTATQILNLYAYKVSFVQFHFGYGSALAVVLLLLTLLVSLLLFRVRTAK